LHALQFYLWPDAALEAPGVSKQHFTFYFVINILSKNTPYLVGVHTMVGLLCLENFLWFKGFPPVLSEGKWTCDVHVPRCAQ